MNCRGDNRTLKLDLVNLSPFVDPIVQRAKTFAAGSVTLVSICQAISSPSTLNSLSNC